jgi:predicted phosphodiesterase
MSLSRQVSDWILENDKDGITTSLSIVDASKLYQLLHPNSQASFKSIKSYIQRTRSGKAPKFNDKVDINEIAQSIERNLEEAKIFKTEDVEVLPDFSDPLGYLIDFPNSWSEINEPVVIQGIKKLGVCNDIHLPYHCPYGVRACFSEFKKRGVDGIYLNGDILDMEEVSRFEKMPTGKFLKDEIEVGRKFLESMRKMFPNIPIYWKDGNHEKRFQSYINTKCDELANLYGMDIPTQLQFDKYDIQYVPEYKVAKFGKLWIAHGHELGLKSGTVNIARQVRMRVGVNVMFGHWHKNQNDSSRNLADEVHSAWAIGCLCYLKPRYTGVLNQWTQGGATIDLHEDGSFTVSAFQIQDGVVI